MRCSWCEPRLDAYLEASLAPRRMRAIAVHLQRCSSCAALLHELRVVDALLATTRSKDVPSDFTSVVLSATRRAPRHARRSIPPWLPLGIYLACAWALLAVAQFEGRLATGFFATGTAGLRSAAVAIGAGVHALAPVTPIAAAAVTSVLVVDLLLAGALIIGYRRVRPLIAMHLAKERRP